MSAALQELSQRVKRSNFIWRISGLTYWSAIRATRGKYLTFQEYLGNSRQKVSFIDFNLRSRTVMEFGCGIGGNLFVLSSDIKQGYGLDINGLYIHQAKRFSERLGLTNVIFYRYDGINFPQLPKLDVIFSFNVFERISKDKAIIYFREFKKMLSKDGTIYTTFLGSDARKTGFVNRLGEGAYTFWTKDDITDMLKKAEISDWDISIKPIPIMPKEDNVNAWLVKLHAV